ncbi:MAG: hypothetical protein AAGI88_26125 [Pseudomonadota bacterium]
MRLLAYPFCLALGTAYANLMPRVWYYIALYDPTVRVLFEALYESNLMIPALLIHDLILHIILALPAALLITAFNGSRPIAAGICFVAGAFFVTYYRDLLQGNLGIFSSWSSWFGLMFVFAPLFWILWLNRRRLALA